MEIDTPASLDVDEEIELVTALGSKLINAILEREPLENIKVLIDSGAPLWYQDEAEGMSPLHAAACVDGENEALVRLLINEGAIWNAGRLTSLSFCSILAMCMTYTFF